MGSTEILKKSAEQAIDSAMSHSIQGCDVIAAMGDSFSLSSQSGEIDKYKVSSSNVLGIRVIKDQKVAISYTESLDPKAIDQMVSQAIQISEYSSRDENQSISVKNEKPLVEDHPKLYKEDTASTDEKVDLALRLESEVLNRDKRIKNCPYNGYADGESRSIYLNHLGTFCSHKERAFSCYTSVLAEDDQRQSMFSHSNIGRSFQDLSVEDCVNESVKYALPLLEGKAVPTGKYEIVFDIEQLDALLGCFSHSFSAKSAMEGKSQFRDRLHQKVANPMLTIRDLPKYENGFYYSSFDDEGNPRQDTTLIDEGVLKNFYHNSATAHFFNAKSTGHAARSARGALSVSGTHIVIDTGKTSEVELESGDYIRVIGLKGLHSGTNGISGQFSLALDGIYYKNGQTHQYVRDVTISGNFYQLLDQIVAVGDTLYSNTSQTFFSPKIRFAAQSIAGT
ncbi:MAG: TldD/PmbA family protein [Pseudobacteriovorax sp.]|nr:TldD/PmbA family protein [Pseudobacteriovorax sp.]